MLRDGPQRDESARALVAAGLAEKVRNRTARIAVIGLGYVGLPLVLSAHRAGFPTLGFDIDAGKIDALTAGRSYLNHIEHHETEALAASDLFEASSDWRRLETADAICICVPTPLTANRDPDLSFVEETCRVIARVLRPGQLICLESTTYPGTTIGIVRDILEARGLRSGQDFFLAYSPEREDPGNPQFQSSNIPKIVSGDGEAALELAHLLYGSIVARVVPVSSTQTAEAVKLTENIFRAVNIALVNELKVIYAEMGVDIWEVIAAAETKPFGYMPFYPGPGLGGHCIPIDPFYLTWKAKEFGLTARLVELAGEINTDMPRYVVNALAEALDRKAGLSLSKANILVLGIAYKKNVNDCRESPSFRIIELLEDRGAITLYHDPLTPEIPATREHPTLAGRRSAPLNEATLKDVDAVLVVTDHDDVDYELVARHARLAVDTRNVFGRLGIVRDTIVKS